MDNYLYRGVNKDLYTKTNGKLVPKELGVTFKKATYFGGDSYFSDGTVYGESETNAVILHQRDSNKHPSSGVSTTPVLDNAKRYAMHDGKYEAGYVFKIMMEKLDEYGVNSYSAEEYARNPAIPEDKEVILVASDFGTLPDEIIAEILQI